MAAKVFLVKHLPELLGKLGKLVLLFQHSLLWASTSFTTKTRLYTDIGRGQVSLSCAHTGHAGLLLKEAAAEQLRQ